MTSETVPSKPMKSAEAAVASAVVAAVPRTKFLRVNISKRFPSNLFPESDGGVGAPCDNTMMKFVEARVQFVVGDVLLHIDGVSVADFVARRFGAVHIVTLIEFDELLIEKTDARPCKSGVLIKYRGKRPVLKLSQAANHTARAVLALRAMDEQRMISRIHCV